MNANFVKTIKIGKNQKICIINMPVPFRGELADIPEGVTVTPRPVGKFDKVVLFTNSKEELTKSWNRLIATLTDKGEFWVVYPNKSLRIYNEIDDEFLKEMAEKKNTVLGKKVTPLTGWNGIEINKLNPKL